MIAYLDASVVLRVLFEQPDALPQWSTIDQGVSSALLTVECLRVLDRKRVVGNLNAQQMAVRRDLLLRLLSSVELVHLDPQVLERAAQPLPTSLGALDAIHLATGLLWMEGNGTGLVFATHDRQLALAAQAHGLSVIGVD